MASEFADAIQRVLQGNRHFSQKRQTRDPNYFPTLAAGQSPDILWLGCSDSRVPETTICHCQPGDIFVHRNIANIIHPDDTNSLAVIEYAVAHLKVKKIILCGHTKCGGAAAGLGDADLGEVLNTWLLGIREVRRKNQRVLDGLKTDDERAVRLAELNVEAGLEVLRGNETVKRAVVERGLELFGFIYDIGVGELRELSGKVAGAEAGASRGGGRLGPNHGLWSPAV